MYNIDIKLLTKNKRVIPLIYQIDKLWTTNIKIPDILVKNNDMLTIGIYEVEVIGFYCDKEIIKLKLYEEDFLSAVKQYVPEINCLIDEIKQTRYDSVYGELKASQKIIDGNKIDENECTVIPLSKILFLNHVGTNAIDTIKINISVTGERGDQELNKIIELEHYKNKKNYIFPIKGEICTVNLPMNITQHRTCLSQEFAFDVIGQSDVDLVSLKHKPDNISKYYIYHKDVLAIGDGVVIDIGDKFPESKMSDPNINDEYRLKLFKQLTPRIGGVNAFCGNYVVIDHENGEYSFYAHLSENTINVGKGDRVKQGQVIARVGNTGNSTDPHLHFQLMDSPYIFKANGLPIMFKNIKLDSINYNLTYTNSLAFSDFLYLKTL